jgi:hypothetical protein
MPVGVLELVFDRDEVEELEQFGLIARALDLAAVCHVGQIEQRPCHGRARDTVDGDDVLWPQAGAAMHLDPLARPSRSPRDVTSIDERRLWRTPCSAAASRCESAAPRPQASTAAM